MPERFHRDIVFLDGALGTALEARGIPLPPPWWSGEAVLRFPAEVQALHEAYAAAGATVHTAATFGLGRPRAGAADATRRAVALARAAVPSTHRVAGSMGPIADCWRPDLWSRSLAPLHLAHARRLAAAAVDLLLVETQTSPDEAVVATLAAAATGLPVWTSLSPGLRGELMSPAVLGETAAAVAAAGASVVLVNCLPAESASSWVDALAAVGVPWGVYANGGADSARVAPDRFGALAAEWVAGGATVIGGCCGTGPAHIAAIVAACGARI